MVLKVWNIYFSMKQNPENLLKNPKIKLPHVSIRFLPNMFIIAIDIFQ